MRSLMAISFALGLGLSSVAQAMPVFHQPVTGKLETVEAKFGCGPNGTRGPYGHCRARFTCPPGWHTGPWGWHCKRNW